MQKLKIEDPVKLPTFLTLPKLRLEAHVRYINRI